MTIDSVTRIGSIPSTQWPKRKLFNTIVPEQESIFEDQLSEQTLEKGCKRNSHYQDCLIERENTQKMRDSMGKENLRDMPNRLAGTQ